MQECCPDTIASILSMLCLTITLYTFYTHMKTSMIKSTKEKYSISQIRISRKNIFLWASENITALRRKLVHDIWSRECCLVGREVWRTLARMALMLFFFLDSQEDQSSQSSLEAGRVHGTGSGQQNVHENVYIFRYFLALLFHFPNCWLAEHRGPSGGLWGDPTRRWKAPIGRLWIPK